MKWQEIRERFPHRWLVLEALKFHREGDFWVADDMGVLGDFGDGFDAMHYYHALKTEMPQREIFFFHSDKEAIRIEEVHSVGLRR
jgi:hypothetical protein